MFGCAAQRCTQTNLEKIWRRTRWKRWRLHIYTSSSSFLQIFYTTLKVKGQSYALSVGQLVRIGIYFMISLPSKPIFHMTFGLKTRTAFYHFHSKSPDFWPWRSAHNLWPWRSGHSLYLQTEIIFKPIVIQRHREKVPTFNIRPTLWTWPLPSDMALVITSFPIVYPIVWDWKVWNFSFGSKMAQKAHWKVLKIPSHGPAV
jgi:hypothetical protein